MNFLRPALIVGPLPVTLLNGTTADATQVMSDLNWLMNQVNANAAPLANTAVTNANNNFTTVQSGQAATQPANFPIASQIQNNALQNLSSVLGTNTITGRVSAVTLGAYVGDQIFTFFPANANTAAATLNIDGIGAKSILNMGSALSGAELQSYRPSMVVFDASANAFDLANGTPYVQGPNIPSAATLNLDGTFGDYSQVDGTTNITAMTLSRGRFKLLEFNSSPLLTHSASLVLGSNLTPKPGDVAGFRGEAGGVTRMVEFFRSNVNRWPSRTVITAFGSGVYVTKVGCLAIDVELVGGGSGGVSSNGGMSATAGNTAFGTLTANGGGSGANSAKGIGGSASGGDVNIKGGDGGGGSTTLSDNFGGWGGQSFFGGSGSPVDNGAGGSASPNSGSGGAGGSVVNQTTGGGGGGAGGYVRKLLVGPNPTYTYNVGQGTGGGVGGNAGGAGADGIIIVTELF